jgi:hypothetical protein
MIKIKIKLKKKKNWGAQQAHRRWPATLFEPGVAGATPWDGLATPNGKKNIYIIIKSNLKKKKKKIGVASHPSCYPFFFLLFFFFFFFFFFKFKKMTWHQKTQVQVVPTCKSE